MNILGIKIPALQQIDITVWIGLSAGVLFFILFAIFLGSRGKSSADTASRMKEIASEGPALDPQQGKRKRVVRRKRIIKSEKLRKKVRQLEDELYNVGINLALRDFILIWIGAVILLSLALVVVGMNTIVICIVILIVALLPAILIKLKKKKRCSQLEAQLIDAIQILSNALKAGYSFTQAMSNIASEMDGPIAEEFGRVFTEVQHGMNMDESLDAMCARIGSDDLNMLCTAVQIQRQVGGNLSEILLNISGTIKARIRLKADIRVKSASGRISGLIIGALPIILFVMFMIINPGYMEFFTSSTLGFACLAFCGFMEVMAFVFINKIISIKY